MSQERTNTKNEGARRKTGIPSTLTFTLSATRFGALCLLLLLGIGWAFILGIMVGRGYQPEKEVPPLARLLPPSAEDNATANSSKSIMKPEELTFMNSLRNQEPLKEAEQPVLHKSEELKPAADANTKSTASTPATSTEKPEKRPPTPEKKPEKKAEKAEAVYDYVFQVASFKRESEADNLRLRLESAGMRTTMAREKTKSGKGTWYKVQVLLRGSEAKALELRETVAQMGLGKALRVSKTSVKRR